MLVSALFTVGSEREIVHILSSNELPQLPEKLLEIKTGSSKKNNSTYKNPDLLGPYP